MVKSTLEFIMLMCVHLSAQDRHQEGELGGGHRKACVPVQIAGELASVLFGCTSPAGWHRGNVDP